MTNTVQVQRGIDSTVPLTSQVTTAALMEVLEACDEEELLQEDLRVQDGDVGRSADEGVGCVGQGVNDIISHEIAVFVLEDWQQQVFNHLCVHGTLYRQEDSRVVDIFSFFLVCT